MIAAIARLSALVFLLVLAAGCSKPPAVTRTVSAPPGEMRAVARVHERYSDVEVGKRALRLDGVRVRQLLLADFNGKRCLAVLTDGEKPVSLYEITPDALEEMWTGLSQALKPWKLQVGDVDGDGSDDLMVGVYKKARFHPVMAKRPFIYGWDGRTMYPKWLGSRLSRPFTDFVLADFGSGARIVAVEETVDGARELSVYKWDGFGVTREWSGARSKESPVLEVVGGSTVRVAAGSLKTDYVWKANSLQPKEARR